MLNAANLFDTREGESREYLHEVTVETGKIQFCPVNYIILDMGELYVFVQYYGKDETDAISIVRHIFRLPFPFDDAAS